ncbi:small integral membrane protein 14 [Contarinia nasturtii]|uniref:small integral membrane protein 14 n=1 Tax=Contarinia nasturtii TaxID=265458 RepID=UPI0012D3A453|nr:small integral membrane protein 14 [Contarinia nasturtii]XP_031641104.1 small integral membrane protein 14 [Contarinia nasturtii]XP_031641105.1 small integral membrane protein 14 [Contarinia nasturtii]XP_031641106.1 small integral membrane protein 14 [Contarinia nasturtii]XP_031641107.1 small integral membrane protein 14 [Contarinia nasturtii]
MGDEMDECACFWSHEFAMRRLLALLRQGQTHCTDTECFDPPTLPDSQRGGADSGSDFMFMSILLICAVILYIFRPNPLRRSRLGDQDKSSRPPSDQNGPDGTPPALH